MIHAPIKGLLHVWGELRLALIGRNGFGGSVAEIYAYHLTAVNPLNEDAVRRATRDGVPFDSQAWPVNDQPRDTLWNLLQWFSEEHDGVLFEIDGVVGPNRGQINPRAGRWHIAIVEVSDRTVLPHANNQELAALLLKFGDHLFECQAGRWATVDDKAVVSPCSCGWTDLHVALKGLTE